MAADRILATYRLTPLEGPARVSRDDVLERARAVARESTLEVPEGVASAEIEERLLGRVESMEEAEGGAWLAVLSHAPEILDGGLPQLLNVVHGNVSLLPGVRLVDLELPDRVLAHFPGPRFGIDGLRARTAGEGEVPVRRPLVAAAIKPVGLAPGELARLAAAFARAGVDVIKDDHSLANQVSAPFRERARAVAEAVAEANAATGGHTAYYANVTGPVERMAARASWAEEVGCGGLLVSPGLVGLDALRALRDGPVHLPIMSHPSRADVGPERDTGVAPEIWFGLFHRLAGADAVVYVNAGGRFAWSVETCQAVNTRLRAPLGRDPGRHPAALPVPAGGVDAEEAPRWFRAYGPDTMLLIGGSLLEETDVEAAARRLVERARAAGEAPADSASTPAGKAP